VGLAEKAALEAHHREGPPRPIRLFARLSLQHADVERSSLAGQLAPKIDRLWRPALVEADAPAEKGRKINPFSSSPETTAAVREVEEQRAVEKEVALLGKEQREPRQVRLPLIDFRLREIGVHREVGSEARRQ